MVGGNGSAETMTTAMARRGTEVMAPTRRKMPIWCGEVVGGTCWREKTQEGEDWTRQQPEEAHHSVPGSTGRRPNSRGALFRKTWKVQMAQVKLRALEAEARPRADSLGNGLKIRSGKWQGSGAACADWRDEFTGRTGTGITNCPRGRKVRPRANTASNF